jgi:CRP/FNR family transcriptional regulator, cyclic AMP receptor protein
MVGPAGPGLRARAARRTETELQRRRIGGRVSTDHDQASVVEFLGRVPLLRHARPQDLQGIAEVTHRRRLREHEVLFREGSEGRELYIVESGEIIISQRLKGRVETVIARIGPREFFGELRMLLGGRRSATAQATCDSVILYFPAETLMDIVRHRPEAASRLLLALAEELADRLTETNAKLRDAIAWGLQATGMAEEPVGADKEA